MSFAITAIRLISFVTIFLYGRRWLIVYYFYIHLSLSHIYIYIYIYIHPSPLAKIVQLFNKKKKKLGNWFEKNQWSEAVKANLFEKNLCPHPKSRDKLPGSKKSRGQPKPRWYTARSVVVCPSTCNRTMYFGYATNSWWIDWIYHRMEKIIWMGLSPHIVPPCLSHVFLSCPFPIIF